MRKFLGAQLIVYLLIGTVSAVTTIGSLQLGLGKLEELGPGLVPFVTSLSIFGGVIFLILRMIAGSQPVSLDTSDQIDQKGQFRVVVILLNFAVWPLLVNNLGYILSTIITSFGVSKAIGFRGWIRPILFSVSIAVCIWFIFGFMFQTDLPAGFSG